MLEVQPWDEHNQALVEQVHPPQWENPKPAERYNLVAIGGGSAGIISALGAAGLGGKAADSIGRKIQAVAQGHQAITITHLAPIAARADHHLLVTKAVTKGRGRERTVSRFELVEGEPRSEELARMIDGAHITPATREAARAMLARA